MEDEVKQNVQYVIGFQDGLMRFRDYGRLEETLIFS